MAGSRQASRIRDAGHAMSALARFSSLRPGSRAPALRGPARRGARGRLLRAGLIGFAAVGIVASGLAGAAALMGGPSATGGPAPGGAAWVEIRRPMALYHLAGTAFARLPAAYRARRRDADDTREDLLAFGHLGDERPFLQLSLLRAAGPDGAGPPQVAAEAAGDDLADGLARLAGTAGLAASRIHPLGPVDTRLGPVETAELDLREGDAAASCLGFRSGSGGVLRVSGFACGTPAQPASRAGVACAIDRLDLVSAGEDAALRAVFVAAERRGGAGCREGSAAAGSASALAIGRRGGWLEPDGELPPLRGLFEATLRQP